MLRLGFGGEMGVGRRAGRLTGGEEFEREIR